MSNRHRSERGQTLVTFALSMVLFLFGLFVATVDLVFLYHRYTTVSAAAQIAAQSGANDVDPTSLYSGQFPKLDVATAVTICQSTGDSASFVTGSTTCTLVDYPNKPGQCIPPGNICAVHVVVKETVILPLSLFGVSSVVTASADAAPVPGAFSPSP